MKETPIVIDGQPIGTLKASWLLCKEAWRFLRADSELLLVPIIVVVASMFIFFIAMILAVVFELGASSMSLGQRAGSYSLAAGVYLGLVLMGVYAQAVVANTVFTRASGGDATLGESFRSANNRFLSLLLWSVVTGTVGLILRLIADRSRLLSSLVAGLLGAAWNILTYFVVPVIVLERNNLPVSIKRSARIFKETWGESLASNITLGAVFLFGHLAAILILIGSLSLSVALAAPLLGIFAMILAAGWLISAIILQTVLESVLRTLLYVYAAKHQIPSNFNAALLENILARQRPAAGSVDSNIE